MRVNAIRLQALGIATCLALAAPPEASAWGPDGHRIICRIATQLLDAPTRTIVVGLTDAFRTPDGGRIASFPDGCVFADDARGRARDKARGWERFARFETWHFLNVPRTTTLVEEASCQGACVLAGVALHAQALAGTGAAAGRGEALFFLGHWVGDAHQPLHVSYADDRGGNNVTPIDGGFYPSDNLHAVWDSGLVAHAVGKEGWQAYADRLARGITPAQRAVWAAHPALTWAQESYLLTTDPRTRYCMWRTVQGAPTCASIAGGRTLTKAYQNDFTGDVARRLQQAGARLAELLRRHLKGPG